MKIILKKIPTISSDTQEVEISFKEIELGPVMNEFIYFLRAIGFMECTIREVLIDMGNKLSEESN